MIFTTRTALSDCSLSPDCNAMRGMRAQRKSSAGVRAQIIGDESF